ncbi:MAG: glycoside hydrolase family 2 protein [Chitinophagaceae bacterium]|nr:glycoside hydrolase family 2 protein [Chitinophagaceae bacterium]
MKKFLLLLLIVLAFTSGICQIQWPAISQQTKPWARWWWEGSAVNKKDLTANMLDYQAAGLGGLEITPIYGVHGYEKEFINFLAPQWMQMLDHTIKEAKRLDLGIDLANGTGWPFGGPTTSDKDASKTILYKTYTISEGEELKENIIYTQEKWIRVANDKQPAIEEINRNIPENKNLQSLALDQVKFPGHLPLQSLMAYSDKGTIINLTGQVDAGGKLNWKAPPGKWTLYALFEGLHGKMVERAAPGGEGYAIDHFSREAVKNYFRKFDDAFRGYDISYIRALFNDSYEVDDARGQSNWTPRLFEEFQKRRGYDLRDHLPALFKKADEETNSRIIYDYRSTIDELILEYFTKQWKSWGDTKGAVIRNQSHGSPANLLDLYGAIDIPETEGNDIPRFKFATSAGNVMGKPLVSSESATWLNEHFLSSWGDVKKVLDLFFLGGVNHIFYHGVNYSPKKEEFPGWLFYAAVHFQQTNPQWKDFHALNNYVTRTQSFLQKGRPDNDVLMFYPLADRYQEPGNNLLQHFDNMEHEFNGTDFQKLSEWMLTNGYGFDFFSDRQLQNISFTGDGLMTGGNTYQTILLPANKFISEKSLQKLVDLAKAGAKIIVYKNLPSDVPGFHKLQDRRVLFQNMIKQFQFTGDGSIKKSVMGKGAFMIGNDMTTLFEEAGIRRESLPEKGLSFIRRKNPDGYTYFINNRSDKIVNDWIPVNTKASSVALFDAMVGIKGLAKWKTASTGAIEVLLQLQPFESVIVQTFNSKKTGQVFPYIKAVGSAQPIHGEWTIEFLNGGPAVPAKTTVSKLSSWTDLEGEDVKNFSGTAKYSIRFEKPAGNSFAWLLELGQVNETAEVFLNGQKIGTLIGPKFQVVISRENFKQANTLEIIVSNLMANRISYMDRNNIHWKKFYNTNMPARRRENTKNGLFDASAWKPLPSGLSGPVTLAPVNYE